MVPRTPPPPDPSSPPDPLRRTAQNFALFSFSRHNFHSFFSLLGVFSFSFSGVFEGRDPEVCTFGLSGCRVKPRHISIHRRFKHPQNSTKDPQEREERKKIVEGGRTLDGALVCWGDAHVREFEPLRRIRFARQVAQR